MRTFILRRRCVVLAGLFLALLTAEMQAQEVKGDRESASAKDAVADKVKDQTAQIEVLRKELAAKQKQLDLTQEALRDLSDELKPLRERQQYERDLEQLTSKTNLGLSRLGPADARIHAELSKPTVLEFIETPLADVVDYLKDAHRIEIQMDQKVLEDSGIGADTRVTRQLRGVTLRSALAIILRELDLTWVVDNEVLLITTNDAARRRTESRVYDVRQLFADAEQANSQAASELAAVIDFVLRKPDQVNSDPRLPRPASLTGEGPSAKAVAYRHLLIVRATQQGHREVEALLKEIASTSEPGKP